MNIKLTAYYCSVIHFLRGFDSTIRIHKSLQLHLTTAFFEWCDTFMVWWLIPKVVGFTQVTQLNSDSFYFKYYSSFIHFIKKKVDNLYCSTIQEKLSTWGQKVSGINVRYWSPTVDILNIYTTFSVTVGKHSTYVTHQKLLISKSPTKSFWCVDYYPQP